MHVLDGIIVVFALAAAVRGWRVGAALQIVGLIGLLGGLALGVALVLIVEPHIGGATTKLVVAIVLLIVPPVIVADSARRGGRRLWSVLRRARLGFVDSAGGAVIAAARTLLVFWSLAAIFIDSSLPSVSSAIEGSQIIHGVQRVMPTVPGELAAVERYLSTSGFPQVLANVVPEPVVPVAVAGPGQIQAAVNGSGTSTVRVLGQGCGQVQEGSGFAVTNGLIVTNAHVVAGTGSITVTAQGGSPTPATVISFDPNLDLAVLRPSQSLNIAPLTVDSTFVGRGEAAVILGYPEDGPFDAQPAGVMARYEAEGRNIYDTGLTVRSVYELQADVRPGNSGGPLLSSNGEVIGVVFSRSVSNADVGYALASPAVLTEINSTASKTTPVGSGPCVS